MPPSPDRTLGRIIPYNMIPFNPALPDKRRPWLETEPSKPARFGHETTLQRI